MRCEIINVLNVGNVSLFTTLNVNTKALTHLIPDYVVTFYPICFLDKTFFYFLKYCLPLDDFISSKVLTPVLNK